MNQIVPPKFQFRWSFVASKLDQLPHRSGRLLDLPDDCALPSLEELDQRRDFARVKVAWNQTGFAISIEVSGRAPQKGRRNDETMQPDRIGLWFDARNTQAVHRATRFCSHFMLYPFGIMAKRTSPVVRALPVARAREETQLPDASLVGIQSGATDQGYWVDAWFPAEVLTGFDPASHGKIGFHYDVHDAELGEQTLAVGREFPYESDPSLWQTIELIESQINTSQVRELK